MLAYCSSSRRELRKSKRSISGGQVLYAFGFERIGVVVSDLYFVDPRPLPGQGGAERGVRLEVRMLGQGDLQAPIYSARPIEVGQPVWRADLLEAADGPPGSLNRAHHHPRFDGWEPGYRVFDERLSAGPVQWIGEQLSDLGALLERAGVPDDGSFAADAESLRGCAGEIMGTVQRLLDKIKAGARATAPPRGGPGLVRVSSPRHSALPARASRRPSHLAARPARGAARPR